MILFAILVSIIIGSIRVADPIEKYSQSQVQIPCYQVGADSKAACEPWKYTPRVDH